MTLTQEASRPQNTTALTLNGIASIYYKKGNFEQAREYCLRALEVKPNFDSGRKNLVLALARLNQWDAVDQQLNILLGRNKTSKVYQFLKGELLLKQNQPAEALAHFRNALRSAPYDKKILLNIGIGLGMLGQYRQAEWFLVRAKKLWPGDMRAYLYLIEAGLATRNTARAERYLDELLTRFTIHQLNIDQPTCFEDYGLRPASRKLICNAVNAKIKSLAEEMILKGASNTL